MQSSFTFAAARSPTDKTFLKKSLPVILNETLPKRVLHVRNIILYKLVPPPIVKRIFHKVLNYVNAEVIYIYIYIYIYMGGAKTSIEDTFIFFFQLNKTDTKWSKNFSFGTNIHKLKAWNYSHIFFILQKNCYFGSSNCTDIPKSNG